VNKDEIDLSAYPSYLGVRAANNEPDRVETSEGVGRGLTYAALAGLVGAVLGVAVSRQAVLPVNVDMLMGAVTSGTMVLLYARGAKASPRRGLVALLLLLLTMLFLGIGAILMARGWWVYTLLDEEIGMPMSRSSFVWSVFADPGAHRNLLFPYAVSGVAGCLLALWKVRRHTEG
jgi:hypothetical protein